ncbi:MAG TPA: DUF4893 domain-containing protein [Rhizomicrobium sp.]|nr:DUF4893 domain-containing protein [Rhizomicrobium sp.]
MSIKAVLRLSVLSVSLLSITAAQARWEDVASPYDVQRLSRLQEARAKGMDAAQDGAIQRDARAVHAALAGGMHPISRGEVVGQWHCRTAKSGGILPAIGYGWFSCRVSERGGHLFFEKMGGTQRLAGYLYPHESGGYVLLGAWSVKGEPTHAYSGNGASAGPQTSPDDAIGLLSAAGPGRARIEFPFPGQESVYDVMELLR